MKKPHSEMTLGSESHDLNDAAYLSPTEETLTSLPSSDNIQLLPTLSFDLIPEILCRLPVKLLMQFRCVCKLWNSLISDPKFAKKHLRLSTTFGLHHFMYNDYFHKYMFISYPLDYLSSPMWPNVIQLEYGLNNFYGNHSSCYFVGSCNGILCLAHSWDNCFVLVWNPSIRKFKELPPFQTSEGFTQIKMTHGFGYDHVTDNYKVVVVLQYVVVFRRGGGRVDKTEVKVHTLGTNFWKSIQKFPFGGAPVERSGKYVSGTINWLASKHWQTKSPSFIVSFDLSNESYQKILLPDYGESGVSYSSLGVLKECLCMISGHDVWVMKEYGNKKSWTKLFTVCLKSRTLTNVLHMFEDDQVLVVYDPRNDTFKPRNFKNRNFYVRNTCVESLISP